MEELFTLYRGEIVLKAVFNNDKHEYWVKNAGTDDPFKLVPGPTTALGVLDKPFLVPWASKEAVKEMGWYEKEVWTPDGYVPVPEEEQARGLERLISIKNRIGTMDYDEYWEALKQAKGAHTRRKEGAADAGTMVHLFVEQFIKGQNPAMPTLPLVRNGVEAWLRWLDKAGEVKFTLSEEKIYSRKHRYAGTLDFACTINGIPTMGDLKTSNTFDPKMFWQVSAYQFARQEEYPDEEYEQQVIVRCGKDGTLEVVTSRDYKKDIKAFLACWVLWKRQNELKKKPYQRATF
jgi:hypothetical protein